MEYQIASALYRIVQEMKDGDLREASDGAVECNQKTFEAIKSANEGRETVLGSIVNLERDAYGTFSLGKDEEARSASRTEEGSIKPRSRRASRKNRG